MRGEATKGGCGKIEDVMGIIGGDSDGKEEVSALIDRKVMGCELYQSFLVRSTVD